MNYLLDTNVISELYKKNCNTGVKKFITNLPPEKQYLCTISFGEIQYGIEKLPAGKKKHELLLWLHTGLTDWFSGRIIDLDKEAMLVWGTLRAALPRILPLMDTLIAAAALSRGLTLVTRNSRDFDGIDGLSVENPWE